MITLRLRNLMIDNFLEIIDEHCEVDGIIWTIQWLTDKGFNKEDLLNLGFEEEMITKAEEDEELI